MKVGFIGLGDMGGGMAKSLLAKGFDVRGFDVDAEKLAVLESFGLEKATTISDIARGCELAILCLPNPVVSRHVIFDELLIQGGTVLTVVETSTLTPEIVKEFANKITAEDKKFISAPMIGGKDHAANGTIEFLVEGSNKNFEVNKDIFEAMGSVRFMGDIPSATLAKLAFNLSRYANLAVGVETHRLLTKYDANILAIYEFLSEQSLDNFGQVWKEDLKEMMTSNVPFKPSQVPKKDLSLLTEMAKSQGLDEKLIEAIRDTYLTMEQE